MSEEDSDCEVCTDDDMDDDDDDDVYGDYYHHEEVEIEMENKKDDPEYYEFELLKVEDVDRLLNESVEALSKAINVSVCVIVSKLSDESEA